MVTGVQSNKTGSGLCPHGLPPSACPICSGGMGGNTKKADFSAKPGEMSWNECAAIGAMMRAAKLRKQMNIKAHENRMQQIATFEKTMMNISQKLAQITMTITNNLPVAISKPITLFVNKLLIPMLQILKNIPTNFMKMMENFKQKFIDIQDKLNAIFGELKNAIDKKISDAFKNFKKKIRTLFHVEESAETTEDEKKVEEDKRAFEVKTFIHDLYSKINKTFQISQKGGNIKEMSK